MVHFLKVVVEQFTSFFVKTLSKPTIACFTACFRISFFVGVCSLPSTLSASLSRNFLINLLTKQNDVKSVSSKITNKIKVVKFVENVCLKNQILEDKLFTGRGQIDENPFFD